MDQTLTRAGLSFFGAMTASISHEIKNRMAVINEQAGLLEDLVLMSKKGKALEAERLLQLAGKVKNQISMADAVIKNMNRFAHSVDKFRHAVRLSEVLQLSTALSKRPADIQGVTVQVEAEETPVRVSTSPFFLMNLIWLCLEKMMEAGIADKVVQIGNKPSENGATLSIKADVPVERLTDILCAEAVRELIRELGAHAAVDADARTIIVVLPADAGESLCR